MKRFIFVCFAFLAFAFYQMSGGADFQPRVAAIAPTAEIEVTRPGPVRDSEPVRAVSLIAAPARAVPEPAPVAFVTPAPALPANREAAQLPPAPANPIAEPLVLASLGQGLAGLTDAVPVVSAAKVAEPAATTPPPADIREITGTRVNMRNGPGTTYAVLTRLSLGDEVEVLEAPGNGWLRLRTLPEQRVGWISASLVSKARH